MIEPHILSYHSFKSSGCLNTIYFIIKSATNTYLFIIIPVSRIALNTIGNKY